MKVILTHEHADFDAVASQLGAYKIYPDAIPVLPRQVNRNVRDFLSLYGSSLHFVSVRDVPKRRVELAILVDTQGAVSIRGMDPHTRFLVIDHHEPGEGMPKEWEYIGDRVGANTTLLVEKIAEAQVPITPLEATFLLLGIYEDTGSLLYPTTTPRDVRAAAWLLERNANLEVARTYLFHPLSDSQKVLYQQLVERSEAREVKGYHILISVASVHKYVEEISTVVHKLRTIYEPDALFVLVAQDGNVQIVARSRTDNIDVGAIAREFGGGGHPRASAALVKNASLDSVRKRLTKLLDTYVRPAVTVSEIMSNGVRTLSPSDTVREAAEKMRRFGHEGFPVIDDTTGEVVGMVTRREIDRAMSHGLEGDPVSRYMRAGRIFVTPDESVQRVRDLMLETDWGQIPVVEPETGKVRGIVTRTDLIKLWGGVEGRHSLAPLMEERWPPLLLALLRRAGEAAQEMDISLYAVGGSVRDLILGQPNFDVDLVAEGDTVALAKRLRQEYGGRVISHGRFGTAKWFLPDEEKLQKALGVGAGTIDLGSLDFATARAEFYTHPSALPTVESGSIKLDLLRRDFTINTLAVRLNPDRWGELLDFYGGMRDLEQGVIRVLHSLSFIDDPTRILRAVRFEQRFGFHIEPRTEELIGNALDLLERVSGARLRHELELILREHEPEKALRRLGELGVLPYLNPEFHYDSWVEEKFQALRDRTEQVPPPGAIELLYFGVLAYRLSHEAHTQLFNRFKLRRETARLMEGLEHLRSAAQELEAPGTPPSRAYELLKTTNAEARYVFAAVTDSHVARTRVERYEREWQYVHTETTGEDLKAMGLKPSPLFRDLLRRLLYARLDGLVHSQEDEEALLRSLLKEKENC